VVSAEREKGPLVDEGNALEAVRLTLKVRDVEELPLPLRDGMAVDDKVAEPPVELPERLVLGLREKVAGIVTLRDDEGEPVGQVFKALIEGPLG